ncbi:ABC transporter permease subunit [Leucobacter sp. HY1908]
MSRTQTVPISVRGRARSVRGHGRWGRWLLIASFLGPALVFLGAFVAYPIIYTVIRSFYDKSGASFAGWNNYVTMFTNDSTFTAIRNNLMWVLIVPVTVTIIGLLLAVLVEKLGWKTAFRLIVFMPMAISMLAAGVIFRGMFQESPKLGVVNAAIVGVQSAFSEQSSFPGAKARQGQGLDADGGIIFASDPVAAGGQLNFPLTGIRQSEVPDQATDARPSAKPSDTQVTGTVFLDVVRGGGGTDGALEAGKKGLPGVRVDAVAADGSIRGYATTGAGGEYVIDGLEPGESYRVALPAANFGAGPQGVSWLSSTFINVVVILSYVWIWAGFAMVMIASGLSAIDRSLQEAARTDGANEWQVFSRITAPLLSPVLVVVLVTLIINVLKIFDLVYVIPPGASKPAANVIAVEMWTVSFGGGANQGLGSALAILLLILVLPSMIINVRRFKEERSR